MSGIQSWIQKLTKAEKTCINQDGKRKIHYTFEDKTEMAEEYSLQTGDLLVRKWRKKSTLGATLPWEFEIGQAENLKSAEFDMIESSNNPVFVRQDAAATNAFQWRIRNLVYPASNYAVEVVEKDKCIVVRTQNKKYYKKFSIPDLDRIGMGLEEKNLSHSFANNTLIITYAKPNEFVAMESMIRAELSKTKATKDGDVECNPS